MIKVLLVEDDPMISKTLKLSLSYRGFQLTLCEDYSQALSHLNQEEFHLVLLDLGLPGGSGFDLCREIRTMNRGVPIVIITGKVDESSAVRALTQGADDYVRKPFGLEELTARMKRLLSRMSKENQPIQFHSIQIDIPKRVIYIGNSQLALGKREFDILTLLVRKSGDVVTRDEILSALRDNPEIYDRTIDSHLSHLRKKLKQAGLFDVLILPVYGVGYRLKVV